MFGFAAVRYLDHEIEGRQLRTLRELDRKVAELVRSLEERGVLDRTIIVYASDNGFLWGEHRLGGKIWPYEESIRVPLVVRVPWRNVWGTKDRHLVLNIDFASTIAALARVRPRLKQDGRSVVPLLRGLSTKWRKDFLVEYLGASAFEDGGPPPFRALRTTRWLYVEYLNGWRELYDLALDPWELWNVAADPAYAGTRNALERRLGELVREPARAHP